MTEATIFAEASALPEGERATYLDEVCGDDPALRERIEKLLASHDNAESFMANPAGEEFAATLDLSAEDLEKMKEESRARAEEPPSVSIVVGL